MKEQDIRAVESMCRCGLDPEGLISSFPKFPEDEIRAVYEAYIGARNEDGNADKNGTGISINCS